MLDTNSESASTCPEKNSCLFVYTEHNVNIGQGFLELQYLNEWVVVGGTPLLTLRDSSSHCPSTQLLPVAHGYLNNMVSH